MAQAHPAAAADGSVVLAGGARIPVRNVWLLLLYASEFYQSGPEAFDGVEEYPERLPELLAELLAASTEDRLRRALTPSFAKTSRDLARVRGGIDTLRTESHQLLSRGLVACRFEELTVDTPRNRLIRTALESIAKLCGPEELRRRCLSQSQRLARLGVGTLDLHARQRDRAVLAAARLTRNDQRDRSVLLAARLALELSLPFGRSNPGHGRGALEERQFRSLFRRAVGGFYAVHGRARGWTVQRDRKVGWATSEATLGMAAILPHMVTDVWIDDPRQGHRLLVDAKFASAIRAGRFARETLRSGHLYELYTHVREQESGLDPASLNAGGLLLYPSTGAAALAESFVSSGHRLGAATVDLSVASVLVRDQLIAAVAPYLGAARA